MDPEDEARVGIDAALLAAGWQVQDRKAANLMAGRGVAIRQYPLKAGHGEADYLLYVDGQAIGVVEAKAVGTTLTGVEHQTEKYSTGIPDGVPAPVKPLPFLYESTGVETRFTNGLDPEPRSRPVFNFHTPETFASWLASGPPESRPFAMAEVRAPYGTPRTLRTALRSMPPLDDTGLRTVQARAIRSLEESFAQDRPRALIQMATGSGKTIMAIAEIYRLIKSGGARRIAFLVDRTNLGKQAFTEFQQYVTPDDGRKFTDLYNVQRLTSNRIDPAARVVITTIQRLFSMLRGDDDLDPDLEEGSQWEGAAAPAPAILAYNPAYPIETFDFIFTDECHRSIYNLWRQVLEYFDAYIVGLTATPSKQTFGFFNQNLVMEYSHEDAVADGVNVDYDVYRIRTQITEQGATIDAGLYVDQRHRMTRAVRWEQLDEDFTYEAASLDRAVVARDQIRTVIQAFRDRLPVDIFPGRSEVPKTLIYAKDDSHADDIVQVVREEFGRGNEFAEKITYRTGTVRETRKRTLADGSEAEDVVYRSGVGVDSDALLKQFRNSYWPRIAVTVDMIATGTDIKPLEIVMFMRDVKSRTYFEQMKGRGVRTITDSDLQGVNPTSGPNDERLHVSKTHFVIVDAVGVTERVLQDSHPLERQPGVSFQKLVESVAFGNIEPDTLSSLASRLARLDHQLTEPQREALVEAAGGQTLQSIVSGIVQALDPDNQGDAARTAAGLPPDAPVDDEAVAEAARELLRQAAAPIASNPGFRNLLIDVRRATEQTIDTTSKDVLLEAGNSEAARERQREQVRSFEQFLDEHRDEITALQVLYSRPYAKRLRTADIKELADALQRPPLSLTSDRVWQAYVSLDRSRVHGSPRRVLTDIVALVRFALRQDDTLAPFPETVDTRYERWLARQEAGGRRFTGEQRWWLDAIKDTIAASFAADMDAFELTPFAERGGAGRAYRVFGEGLAPLLEELNRELVA